MNKKVDDSIYRKLTTMVLEIDITKCQKVLEKL